MKLWVFNMKTPPIGNRVIKYLRDNCLTYDTARLGVPRETLMAIVNGVIPSDFVARIIQKRMDLNL